MELQFPPFPIMLACFVVMLSIVIKVAKIRKRLDSSMKLPPGPCKLPFIGNIHQLALSSLPHRTLRDLANKHGPLMHLQLGELSTVIVSSAKMAKEVLITKGTNFAQRPFVLAIDLITYNSRDIVMAPYGKYWRQLRKICTHELFTSNRVDSFSWIRQEEVSALVKSIAFAEGCPINLTNKIFSMTYGITARAAFGSICKDQETFISCIKEVIKLSSGFNLADMYPSLKVLPLIGGMRQKLETVFGKCDGILDSIINQHRDAMEKGELDEGEANEDLISSLLKVQQLGDLEFSLTDNDIKAVMLDIFGGGGDTSSTMVDWAMAEMVKNPRVLKKAQFEVRQVFHEKHDVDETSIHELKYLTSVIKETFRLHPPFVLLLPRECQEDCIINGFQIPAKTKVMINAWAIGRDAKSWTEPETFYPERFLNCSTNYIGTCLELIPFGAGRRICPGIPFAIPNIELPLAKLLYHFDWKLPNRMNHENLDMSESFGVTARRKEDLILIPTRHNPIC